MKKAILLVAIVLFASTNLFADIILTGTEHRDILNAQGNAYGQYYASGLITGSLINGGGLSNQFSIHDNASIILTCSEWGMS